jgi:hypothetical protein
MLTKDPGARFASPVPGIVPEPVSVQHDDSAPRARTARTTLAGKVLSLLRGDKYMVNAYPPQRRSPMAGPAPSVRDSSPSPSPCHTRRSAD